MRISGFNHAVLVVADLDRSADFYTRALGMWLSHRTTDEVLLQFDDGRLVLTSDPSTLRPQVAGMRPGGSSLSFSVQEPAERWKTSLTEQGFVVAAGPERRSGSEGPVESLYLRDPDGNLIELASPAAANTR